VWAVVLASGLAVTIGLMRAGSRIFWASHPPAAPDRAAATSPVQALALGWLFAALLVNAVVAGPLARYTNAAAGQLFERRAYIEAVLGAQPAPAALPIREIIGGKPEVSP
jgi:multicomponent K+:H+ antiporter subunit D